MTWRPKPANEGKPKYTKRLLPFFDAAKAERSCFSKVRHTSEAVARAVGVEQRRKPTTPPLFVYHCQLCFGWHLTRKDVGAAAAVEYFIKEKEKHEP